MRSAVPSELVAVDADRTYSVSSHRWWVLFLYACVCASNSFIWLAFGPIVHEAKEYFSMSSAQVNGLNLVFYLTHPPLMFPGCIAYERLGLKKCLLLAATLNAIGAILKFVFVYASPTFAAMAFSNLFSGSCSVFYGSLPPLIASMWFPATERTLATSVCTLSVNVGSAIAFVIPPLVINERHKGQHDFGAYFGVAALLCTTFVVAIAATMDTRPPGSPSVTSNQLLVPGGFRTVVRSLGQLLQHRSFLALALVCGMNASVMWTLGPVLAQVATPFGLSEAQAGWVGFAGTVLGVPFQLLAAQRVDASRRYRSALCSLGLGSSVCTALFVLIVRQLHTSAWVFVVAVVCLGGSLAVLAAALPIGLEFAVEITHPQPEAIVASFILFGLSFFSIGVTSLASHILGNTPLPEAASMQLLCFAAMTAVSSAIVAVVKEDRRRLHLEKDDQDGEGMVRCAAGHIADDRSAVSSTGSVSSRLNNRSPAASNAGP